MSAVEKHYSVGEIAEMWGLKSATVRRLFEDIPGVLKISMPTVVNRKHKPHVTLRIPESVMARLHEQRSRGFLR